MPRAPESTAWVPRGLRREEAAYYIGLGTTKFDKLVADRRLPRGKKIDGCVVWDRHALDLAFNDLGNETQNSIDALLNRG